MKKYLPLLFTILAAVSFTSCGDSENRAVLTRSTGKPFDVYVVIGDNAWNGEAGETLQGILGEAVPYMFQYEPRLSIFRILPKNFKGLVSQHRNILIYRSSPEIQEPSITARYNVYSDPQIIVTVAGPNDSVLVHYMTEHKEALLTVFEMAERDRFVTQARRSIKREITEQVKEKFSFDIAIPMGYLKKGERSDFFWITYEHPLATQGIFIYKYPLTDANTFTKENLIAQRNKYARYIPGPSEGSYMITSQEFEPDLSTRRINDRLWFITRGFWDVKNDFMGGPFVNYTTVNATTGEVISIDLFVFSPKYDKRNYMRQLEALMRTVDFPDDVVGTIRLPESPMELEEITITPE